MGCVIGARSRKHFQSRHVFISENHFSALNFMAIVNIVSAEVTLTHMPFEN